MATPHLTIPTFSTQPKFHLNPVRSSNRRAAKQFPPIRYTRDQVNFMVRVSLFGSPAAFAKQVGESVTRLREIGRGKRLPTAPVLRFFRLKKQKASYLWNFD